MRDRLRAIVNRPRGVQFDRMDKCRFENERLHLFVRIYEPFRPWTRVLHTDSIRHIHVETSVGARRGSHARSSLTSFQIKH